MARKAKSGGLTLVGRKNSQLRNANGKNWSKVKVAELTELSSTRSGVPRVRML